jgi:thiamine-monophosphate kinase
MLVEFDLIQRHFGLPFYSLGQSNSATVLTGIGDDCAVLKIPLNQLTFVSTDTLVEGVHFFKEDSPSLIGWKSLACNLSDLAACGAMPLGFTLNLSLPGVDENWLIEFSKGLLWYAKQENCPLVGGDTTSAGLNGNKTISITVLGQAPSGHGGFHRSLANAGDDLWVSGRPGLARLGLLIEYQNRDQLGLFCSPSKLSELQSLLSVLPVELRACATQALQQPEARLVLGKSLRSFAKACVDLSDGLIGDLGHIVQSSALRANVSLDVIQAMWLRFWPDLAQNHNCESFLKILVECTLQGGDDYELCWTASPIHRNLIQKLESSPLRIGSLASGQGVWLTQNGHESTLAPSHSYNHFAELTF